MAQQLRGILTALPTPFAQDGSLDEASLRALVDRSIDGGVHGVVVCGSTGEFTALTGDERRRAVEIVVDQAGGRVPVVAQTGAASTAEAVRLSRHAQSAGADVVMALTPYYEALSEKEIKNYFRTVAGSVDVPVMIYNIPGTTGIDLLPDTVGALAREVENIQYVKNSSSDMSQSAQLIHHHGDVISTFVGWDTLLLASLIEGAAGFTAGTANIVPAELVVVWDAVQGGKIAEARQAWNRVFPVIDAVMQEPFNAAIKGVLDALGHPVGVPREPLAPLDPKTASRIRDLVSSLRLATA
jgi:4-hydroxy-tetrahydrodipicolinate synthase